MDSSVLKSGAEGGAGSGGSIVDNSWVIYSLGRLNYFRRGLLPEMSVFKTGHFDV